MNSAARLSGAGFAALLAALVALGAPALAADGPLAVAGAMGMPYAPVVRVVDTVSSLGPLATERRSSRSRTWCASTATRATVWWWLPRGSPRV